MYLLGNDSFSQRDYITLHHPLINGPVIIFECSYRIEPYRTSKKDFLHAQGKDNVISFRKNGEEKLLILDLVKEA